jgi:Predicted permease
MAELLRAVQRHRLAIFSLATFTFVAWVLWAARGALPAFLIGLALAFVLDPAVTHLHRLGVPRWAGVLVSYVGLAVFIWLILAFALAPISRQTGEFIQQLPHLGATVQGIEDSVYDWYAGLPLPPDLRAMVDQQLAASQLAITDLVRGLVAPTVAAVVRAATFVLGLVVVPVWLFFVLKDRERLPRAIAVFLPPHWRPDAENLLSLLARVGGRWVRGQLLLGGSIFLATAVGLTILTAIGFREFGQFTLVLALVAGVLEWFPIIGPIVAAIPAILIGGSISVPAAIAAALLYIAIQQLENNILVPKVLGDAIELHPAVLIVALVAGGALYGVVGAILAAPVVAAGRDAYRYGFQRLSGVEPVPALELALRVPHATAEPEVAQTAGDAVAP